MSGETGQQLPKGDYSGTIQQLSSSSIIRGGMLVTGLLVSTLAFSKTIASGEGDAGGTAVDVGIFTSGVGESGSLGDRITFVNQGTDCVEVDPAFPESDLIHPGSEQSADLEAGQSYHLDISSDAEGEGVSVGFSICDDNVVVPIKLPPVYALAFIFEPDLNFGDTAPVVTTTTTSSTPDQAPPPQDTTTETVTSTATATSTSIQTETVTSTTTTPAPAVFCIVPPKEPETAAQAEQQIRHTPHCEAGPAVGPEGYPRIPRNDRGHKAWVLANFVIKKSAPPVQSRQHSRAAQYKPVKSGSFQPAGRRLYPSMQLRQIRPRSVARHR